MNLISILIENILIEFEKRSHVANFIQGTESLILTRQVIAPDIIQIN